MPNQMGNSRRGPDDLDRAQRDSGIEDDRELQDERFAENQNQNPDQEPVLAEGEEVGKWSNEDEDASGGISAGSRRNTGSTDEDAEEAVEAAPSADEDDEDDEDEDL
jgi:hypothetical protein